MELTSGFINLNKPSGISSAAAVSKIKRITGLACGHMGTLDPLASGVLPVAFGNASRLFNYLLDKEKIYRAVFRFGTDTDTLDSAGEILKSGLPVPTEDKINSVLSEFVGEIEQVPPIYSAKSVGGVRAYRLARQGKEVELSAKRVTVHSLVLLGRLNETDYEFRISCGGGTYIRSLARDIAAACGTCAVMTSLVREKSGVFELSSSVTLEQLTKEIWRFFAVAPDAVFAMPQCNIGGRDAEKLRNGLKLTSDLADGEYKLYFDGAFYGIAAAENGTLRAKVKLV